MRKLNVLFCHGIGNPQEDYAAETIDKLRSRRLLGKYDDCIEYQSVHWAPVLTVSQNAIMNRMIWSGDVDWQDMRRELIIGGLGDACAYLGTYDGASPHYEKIHKAVADGFRSFSDQSARTMVVCHSMGCIVTMDYLYEHGVGNVECAVLFGNNMPLFWMGRKGYDLRLPEIPRVYNVYDPDDLLGHPLRGITTAVDKWVTGDYCLSVGTIFGAHTGYWTDRTFLRWLSRCVKRELGVLR